MYVRKRMASLFNLFSCCEHVVTPAYLSIQPGKRTDPAELCVENLN